MRRLAVFGLLALVALVPAGIALRTVWLQGGDDDVHDDLVRSFDGLELPDYTLVAEQRFGTSDCLLGDCPRVDRYYASPESLSATCDTVTAAVSSWGAHAAVTGGPGCEFVGKKDGASLGVSVRETTEIEPEFDQIDPPSIDIPYESIVIIGLTGSG